MVCQHCGMDSAPGIRRCPNCDRELTPAPPKQPAEAAAAASQDAGLKPEADLDVLPQFQDGRDPWEDDAFGPSQAVRRAPPPCGDARVDTRGAAPSGSDAHSGGATAPGDTSAQSRTLSGPTDTTYEGQGTASRADGMDSGGVTPEGGGPVSEESPENEPDHVLGLLVNIREGEEPRSRPYKWIRCLFRGVPYLRDNHITILQVAQAENGREVPGGWNREAIIYGQLIRGIMAPRNVVELWGYTEQESLIVLRAVNRKTGAYLTPTGALPSGAAWVITLTVLGLLGAAAYAGWQFDWIGLLNRIWQAVSSLLVMALLLYFLYWAFFRRRR